MTERRAETRLAACAGARQGRRGRGSWGDELRDVLRALGGGFLFAVPLLYTMETWRIGITAERWKLLVFLVVAFLICFGLARSRAGGFKAGGDRFAGLEQAVDGLAVGLVGAVVVLAVLNRIRVGDPLDAVLGKVVVQAVPLAVGASVANAVFGGGRSRDGGAGQDPSAWRALRADLGATAVGAVFLAVAIAPTEEVPLLAAELDYAHELALIALSLLVSYAIVFVSGFAAGPGAQPGPFQHPVTETTLAYAVALLVALASLLLFDQIEPGAPLGHAVSMVLVLGLPAAVGGAAGRLVV